MRAIIFDIERNSYVDGPGIRTTVFFKGCNLKCAWCHNPESQSAKKEFLFYKDKCTGCRRCDDVTVDNKNFMCYNDAKEICGKEYTVDEVFAEVIKDKAFYETSGGGVTFSGGEPMSQGEFVLACLTRLRHKTHRALQTCGYGDGAMFSHLLAECDYVLYDLKLMDEAEHLRYTGVSNGIILENYRRLAASGVPFVTRIPLIPGVNDTEDNLRRTANLMRECGAHYVELLPYNKMAGGKYRMLGRAYEPTFDETVPPKDGRELIESYGIEVRVL